MEVELMEIVRSVNVSWIDDTYFSLYRAFHPGGKSGGSVRGEVYGRKCPGTHLVHESFHLSSFYTSTNSVIIPVSSY